METLKDYYLDSLSELKIDGWMYRTKGSAQIQVWYKHVVQSPDDNFISDRKYFRGRYRSKRFFGKQFIKPNMLDWSVKDSVEYQFENLLLLRNMRCVPEPLFFTNNMVGMEYVEGKTIKELSIEGKLGATLVRRIVKQLMGVGSEVVGKLGAIGRKYDCSYNNILVREGGRIMLVDFDYSNLNKSVDGIIQILEDLVAGVAFFTKNGQLQHRDKEQ